MAEVRPFRGVRYNQRLVKDVAAVICPPYDIISPQMAQELNDRSEYNFVRVEYGRKMPQDKEKDNRYTRSAACLEQWLEQGVLVMDDRPAIYLHDHYFSYQGKEVRRRNMLVRVKLEEWDRKVVRPHEGTLSEPKSDRLSLLWALRANTSPILGLYEDTGGQVASVFNAEARQKPVIKTGNVDGERHSVWAVTADESVSQIQQALAGQPLYIADGHHRYESALTYRRERLACAPSATGEEGFDFVMMELVDTADPGLVILPPHRLIRGVPKATLDSMLERLKAFFDIEGLPLGQPDIWSKVDSLLSGQSEEVRLVLFGLDPERVLVLRLRDFGAASRMMPYFHSEIYKKLDVSIVDHIILEKVLELSSDKEEITLGYTHSREDAVKKVTDGEYQLAFLLSPVKVQVVKAIADAGDRMPRKSTYFYPKTPSGLVFYRFE